MIITYWNQDEGQGPLRTTTLGQQKWKEGWCSERNDNLYKAYLEWGKMFFLFSIFQANWCILNDKFTWHVLSLYLNMHLLASLHWKIDVKADKFNSWYHSRQVGIILSRLTIFFVESHISEKNHLNLFALSAQQPLQMFVEAHNLA